MLGLIGFLTMATIILLLLRSKTIPAIAFVAVPTVMALIAGFSVGEIGGFVKKGVASTSSMAALFIFSITFFGIMTDAGMFDRIIDALVGRAGNNVVAITVLTAVIACIGHLDGSGASTFLITIPAMLPIYQKLGMRATTLMLICTSAMGVMNLMPWGGPTMRAATVVGVDPTDLWTTLIPMQAVGLVICFAIAVIMGRLEIKNGAGFDPNRKIVASAEESAVSGEKKKELVRPKLFWFNLILTIALILVLSFADIPSYYVFMIGVAIALLVNYPGSKLQNKIIKAHSSAAITMASTLLAAGVLLGILGESGIMDAMATAMVSVIPSFMGPYIAIIFGILSVPLALAFDTDSYFYGVLPIVVGIGESFGVNPVDVAIALVVCRNCATFISPVVPATYLGCGLAGVEIKDHIKVTFFWIWGVSLVCLVSGIILGIIRI